MWRAVRQVALTAMIRLLVASGRGLAVLPDWVVRSARGVDDLAVRPLRRDGAPVTRRLYAAVREDDSTRPFVAHLVRLAGAEAVKLQRG